MKTTQQSKQDCLTLCLAGRRHGSLLHFSPAQPAPALTSHQAPKITLLEKVIAWWSLMVREQSRASPQAACSSAFPSSASRAGSVSLPATSRDAPRDGARAKPSPPPWTLARDATLHQALKAQLVPQRWPHLGM